MSIRNACLRMFALLIDTKRKEKEKEKYHFHIFRNKQQQQQKPTLSSTFTLYLRKCSDTNKGIRSK